MAHPVLLLLAIVLVIIIIYWYSKQTSTTSPNTMLVANKPIQIKQSSEIDVPYPRLTQIPKAPEPEPVSATDTSFYEFVPIANAAFPSAQSNNVRFPKFVARKNTSRNYNDIPPTPKYTRYTSNYRDIPNPVYY